jgi:transporter family-2 protein
VTRVAGALIAVLAVGLIRFDHSGGGTSPGVVLALLAAATAGGVWLSLQQALNGRVTRATGQPLVAGLVNFAVGTCALVVVVAVTATAGATPDEPWPGPAWLYAGGALGVVYIVTARLGRSGRSGCSGSACCPWPASSPVGADRPV